MPKPTKIVVIDTYSHFEIELPDGADPEEFAQSEEARKAAAKQIIDGHVEFEFLKVLDENRNEVFEDDLDDVRILDPDEELELLEQEEKAANATA